MPTLGSYQEDGVRDRQETLLLQEVDRQRHVANAGLDDPAQLTSHLSASNGLSEQQMNTDYDSLTENGDNKPKVA